MAIRFLIVLLLIGCNGFNDSAESPSVDQYIVDDITVSVCPDGIIIHYPSAVSGTLRTDTLVFADTSTAVRATLFWPPPYTINFRRK